jgi:AraC-like DNA-binding protein
MIVDGLHEKNIFPEKLPFRLETNSHVDFVYPIHWHSAVEIILIEKNDFNVTVNNSNYQLNENDILFIAGGDTHGFNNVNKPGIRYFIQFDLSDFNTFVNSNKLKEFLSSTFLIQNSDNGDYLALKSTILDIVRFNQKRDFAYELFLCARIYAILAILCTIIAGREKAQVQKTKIYGLDKLNNTFKFIEQNYMNDIRLADVAKAAGFSESYFSRTFKEIMEKDFHDYLNEYRIKQSEYYLTNTAMNVADIAFTVGFRSIVTFNRCFKDVKGCTPSMYKRLQL